MHPCTGIGLIATVYKRYSKPASPWLCDFCCKHLSGSCRNITGQKHSCGIDSRHSNKGIYQMTLQLLLPIHDIRPKNELLHTNNLSGEVAPVAMRNRHERKPRVTGTTTMMPKDSPKDGICVSIFDTTRVNDEFKWISPKKDLKKPPEVITEVTKLMIPIKKVLKALNTRPNDFPPTSSVQLFRNDLLLTVLEPALVQNMICATRCGFKPGKTNS
ncbi:unnamed protein product [Heterobilharzia americana]|nr:unnamed protein product [Heterobilharzia americana]